MALSFAKYCEARFATKTLLVLAILAAVGGRPALPLPENLLTNGSPVCFHPVRFAMRLPCRCCSSIRPNRLMHKTQSVASEGLLANSLHSRRNTSDDPVNDRNENRQDHVRMVSSTRKRSQRADAVPAFAVNLLGFCVTVDALAMHEKRPPLGRPSSS